MIETGAGERGGERGGESSQEGCQEGVRRWLLGRGWGWGELFKRWKGGHVEGAHHANLLRPLERAELLEPLCDLRDLRRVLPRVHDRFDPLRLGDPTLELLEQIRELRRSLLLALGLGVCYLRLQRLALLVELFDKKEKKGTSRRAHLRRTIGSEWSI